MSCEERDENCNHGLRYRRMNIISDFIRPVLSKIDLLTRVHIYNQTKSDSISSNLPTALFMLDRHDCTQIMISEEVGDR